MAKSSPPRDPVTVVIPVHNAADRLEKFVPPWAELLGRYGRDFEILVVDDGSTDTTAAVLETLAGRIKSLRVLRHDTRRGFGACLRAAVGEARHLLLFYTSPDYPYTPSDVRPLLDRIEVRDEIFGRQPDLISGCRMGRPAPFVVKWVGRGWRLFWRIVAGMQVQPAPTWLGWREYVYGLFVKWVFGVPLADVNSAFKLYRTAFLRRVPIQSDGDFVHAELVAKATFLTSIMDEVPLTPKPDPTPPPVWSDMWKVFANPEFGTRAPGDPGNVPPPEPAATNPNAPPDSRGLSSPDSSSLVSFVT
jgi:glycosyltransferase involved in cell wall biosynthesis